MGDVEDGPIGPRKLEGGQDCANVPQDANRQLGHFRGE